MNHRPAAPEPSGQRGHPRQPSCGDSRGGCIALGFHWENGNRIPGTAKNKRGELALQHPCAWDRYAGELKGQGELPSAGRYVPVSLQDRSSLDFASPYFFVWKETKQALDTVRPGSYTSPVHDFIQLSSHPSCHPGQPFSFFFRLPALL